jgi:hypothetical protein
VALLDDVERLSGLSFAEQDRFGWMPLGYREPAQETDVIWLAAV